MIATKSPKDYDAAVTLLLDLQALAVREGEIFEFAEQMTRLRDRHARKPSLQRPAHPYLPGGDPQTPRCGGRAG
ncbi:hypothetical protein ACQP2E_06430 [Actinoplanes sp. CA-015351]|uniref:hypothetical protein n=1 Tax=Actinoplanes sp. CA-015351 TaxID=3239897 RepID=UPI003D990819